MATELMQAGPLRYTTSLPHGLDEFSDHERGILQSVNRKVGAAESLDDVVAFLFEATRPICHCDRVGLALLEDDGRHVVARCVHTLYEPLHLSDGYAEDIGAGSLQAVIEQGTPRIISDLPEYLRQKPCSRSTRLMVREGMRSSMTCPLAVDGRNVGLLFRNSRRVDAYGEHEMRLHLAVAEQLSQAVEKAYRIEQLTQAKQGYLEMLGFVSHELRNPVVSMLSNAGLLADGLLGELQPQQQEEVQRILAKGDYLLNLIREYLDLAQIDDDRLGLSVESGVDLRERIVGPAIDIVRPQIEEKRMRLVYEPDEPTGPIQCDAELLKIVLVNLLGNAAKYGFKGGEIRLDCSFNSDGLKVDVWNEGPGFPDQQRPRLFRKFSRLQTPELLQEKGTGIGLYSVWRIAQLHGGKVQAESRLGQWARFTFEIPQPPVTAMENVS